MRGLEIRLKSRPYRSLAHTAVIAPNFEVRARRKEVGWGASGFPNVTYLLLYQTISENLPRDLQYKQDS